MVKKAAVIIMMCLVQMGGLAFGEGNDLSISASSQTRLSGHHRLSHDPAETAFTSDTEELNIATQNMYVGFNIESILNEIDFDNPDQLIPKLLKAVEQMADEYISNESKTRIHAIADAIVDSDADVVGLQEAIVLKIEDIADDDFVGELLRALEKKSDQKYNAIELKVFEISGSVPIFDTIREITYAEHEAIIYKEEMDCHSLDGGILYENQRDPIDVFKEEISFTRGVVSAVCHLPDGEPLSIYSTHLDQAYLRDLQEGQTRELLNYIEETASSHVVVMGDFNALERWGKTRTYDIIMENGFLDTYRFIHPDQEAYPGYTWGHTDPNGRNRRIDYIFIRGEEFVPVKSSFICNDKVDKATEEGTIWPSDHFGVMSTIEMQSHHRLMR